jgi:hypothetical protein
MSKEISQNRAGRLLYLFILDKKSLHIVSLLFSIVSTLCISSCTMMCIFLVILHQLAYCSKQWVLSTGVAEPSQQEQRISRNSRCLLRDAYRREGRDSLSMAKLDEQESSIGGKSVIADSPALLLMVFVDPKWYYLLRRRKEQSARIHTMQRRCKRCYQSILSTPRCQQRICNAPSASTLTSWD